MQFCATRKGTSQAAAILIKDQKFVNDTNHKQMLLTYSKQIHDSKLKGYIYNVLIIIILHDNSVLKYKSIITII